MRSSSQKKLSPSSDRALDIWERQNLIRSDDEPDLNLRAKTQTVSEGILRYMGEAFEAPERYALGLIGAGEVEQVIDEDRPVAWMQNAPGPTEADRGANATQGSRESGDPDIVVGEQKERQQEGAEEATELQRQLDQTRENGEPGGSALSSEDQMEGATSLSSDLGRRGGDKAMSRERGERGEREEREGRRGGEEREERWMQRLITEQQETIDTQAETIEKLVDQLGEEEEDEERGERRRRRRGEDEDEGRGRRRGRY